jgi:hypothetical protein
MGMNAHADAMQAAPLLRVIDVDAGTQSFVPVKHQAAQSLEPSPRGLPLCVFGDELLDGRTLVMPEAARSEELLARILDEYDARLLAGDATGKR